MAYPPFPPGHPLYGPSAQPYAPPGLSQPTPDQLSEWGRLSRGQALGKTAVIANVSTEDSPTNLPAPISLLQIQGKDQDALNLSLVLAPPKIMTISAPQGAGNWQNLSGFKTIQELPVGDLNPSWPEISAIVEWGIGGISQKAIVDFHNGAPVNLAASYVRVWGQIETIGSLEPPDLVAWQIGASVSRGFTRGIGARRTMSGDCLANSPGDVLAVPAFARRVRLLGSNTGVGASVVGVTNLTMRFYTAKLGNAVGDILFTGNTQDPVDIPGPGMYFQVVDGSGSNTRWTAVFELSI